APEPERKRRQTTLAAPGAPVRSAELGSLPSDPHEPDTRLDTGGNHVAIQYDEKVFEPDGVFGSRGLGTEEGRKIVKARPHVPYEQREAGYGVVLDPKWWGWQLTESDVQIIKARVDRAPGILMVRHSIALPGIVEGPILPEYRPDWPIFTGEEITWHDHEENLGNSPITRAKHIASKKVSVQDLRRGGGLFEGLAPYGYGADHFGVECEGRHPQVDVAKYLFKGQPKIWVPAMPPHEHEDYKTVSGLRKHVLRWHMTYSKRAGREQPVVPDGKHRHGKRPPHDHSEYKTANGLETHMAERHPSDGFYVELGKEVEAYRKQVGIPDRAPLQPKPTSRRIEIPPGAILGGWVGPDDLFPLDLDHQHPDRKRPHRHADYKTAKGLATHVARKHLARWTEKRNGAKLVPLPEPSGWVDIADRDEVIPQLMRERGLSRRAATAVFDDEYRIKILPEREGGTIFVADGPVRMWVLNKGVVGKELTTGNPGYVADDVWHQHVRLAASTEHALAARVDVHPLAVERLDEAKRGRGRTFFVLEGCLKADSILAQGEAVASVPSVSLWADAPELKPFAETHLKDVTVFVVCDSDWERENDDSVIRQAIQCREAIRRYARHKRVFVAAPRPAVCKEHGPGTKAGGKHGVDDFLGEGGSVDDLVVVEREALPDYSELIIQMKMADPNYKDRRQLRNVKRDAAVLRWLVLHAGPDGRTTVAESTIAKNLMEELGSASEHAARETVSRALASLFNNGTGLISFPDGSLSNRKPLWWMKQGNWVGIIAVAERVQAETRKDRIVRDFI
ncbi:MAG: hypothetical protein M3P18_02590, partial [Actinomycetota bacterium]|nr:hypothetical protein [Actinomycetota bacterium]